MTCTGQPVYQVWPNPTPDTLHITIVHLGADIRNPQSRGNVHLLLSRLSDGEVVANDRWNLYGLTNSWISSRTLFAPHWMDLAPGDALVLQSFCQNINGIASAAKAKAHVWWWTGDTQ